MDRITGPNNVLVNGLRMWADRNQATGVAGTFGNALWMNGVQEELIGILTLAGVAPNAANNGQVAAALRTLFGGVGLVAGVGWMQFSGGIILQWGQGQTTTGNQDIAAFPTTFPNAMCAINITEGNSTWGNPPSPSIYGSKPAPAPNNRSFFLVSAVQIPRSGPPNFLVGAGYTFIAVGF